MTNDAPMLYLTVTGAPLTRRVGEAVRLGRERGWQVAVIATDAATGWLNRNDLDSLDVPVLTQHRQPDTAKRLPRSDAIVLAPATFNTVNKLAAGIADTYALSVLCEALGAGRPVIVVPFVSQKLAGHPAWPTSLAILGRAGVHFIDPRTGRPDVEPHESGTGDAVADAFRWPWAFDRLTALTT